MEIKMEKSCLGLHDWSISPGEALPTSPLSMHP